MPKPRDCVTPHNCLPTHALRPTPPPLHPPTLHCLSKAPPLSPTPSAGGEALDYILMEAFGGPEGGAEGGQGGQGGATGFINQLGLTISGLQRFMRSLSQ